MSSATRRGAESTASAGPKPLTFAERKELEGILDEVTSLEARVHELEERLADPALYAGKPDDARRTREDHVRAREELAKRTARWEELEARRDVGRR